MRRSPEGFFSALEVIMKKRKTPRMSQDSKTTRHGAERRNQSERRADDRRAHTRFEPGSPARSDRRQGERRRRS